MWESSHPLTSLTVLKSLGGNWLSYLRLFKQSLQSWISNFSYQTSETSTSHFSKSAITAASSHTKEKDEGDTWSASGCPDSWDKLSIWTHCRAESVLCKLSRQQPREFQRHCNRAELQRNSHSHKPRARMWACLLECCPTYLHWHMWIWHRVWWVSMHIVISVIVSQSVEQTCA